MKKKIAVFGGGAHSKVVLDIILQSDEYEIAGVVDREGMAPFGLPLLGREDDMNSICNMDIHAVFIAVGSNHIRRILIQSAQEAGLELINVVAKDAVISTRVHIGKGVLINHGVIVNADACIGDGVILNTGCSVDHDCNIGAYSHIAPGVHISGSTQIGNESFLGTGSCVIDKITIGHHVMVGAGAAVVKNLPDNCTAVGVPARVIK